jgi:predicted MPP superfamily phosphohydrolase
MPRSTIVIVLSLLALLHFYIGVRLIPGLQLNAYGVAAGVLLLAVSTLLLPAGLMASRLKRWKGADQLAWAGMLAMGFFSSLLVLTVLRDALLLALTLLGAASAAVLHASALGVPLLALGVTLVGFVNARRVARVVEVEVPIAGLPAALHGYTIVQISDIHVGPTIKHGYLNAIVSKVNALNPDAIAITGDLVDGSVQRLAAHTAPLARLVARDGTFFVTGNHEYYSGAKAWIVELRRLGLTVLLNEHVLCERDGEALMIAGVTDFTAHQFDPSQRSDARAAGAGARRDVSARILLAHQPRSAPAAAEAGFDLQLSGHTHGGQFFPWNLFVPLQQPFTAGLNRLSQLWVYTSRGTGYWGPPKRFGAPSEITRLRLVPA